MFNTMFNFKCIILCCLTPFFVLSQIQTTETLFYDGENREYILYVPESYNGTVEVPVVFSFHGGAGHQQLHQQSCDHMTMLIA